MSVPTFSALLTEHLNRAGISDSELARSIGVRRQTVFRWKEGLVERPRAREDVLRCASKLRLTAAERDRLLLSAGFAPDALVPDNMRDALEGEEDEALSPPRDAVDSVAAEQLPVQADLLPVAHVPDIDAPPAAPLVTGLVAAATTVSPTAGVANDAALPGAESHNALAIANLRRLLQHPNRRYGALSVLVLLVLFVLLFWRTLPHDTTPVEPTAVATVVQVTLNAPVVPAAAFPAIHPTAQPGEILLLVAPFAGYTVNEQYNVAGRLQEALIDEIANARLISTTIALWPEQIQDRAYLEQVLTASNAALLIWGEYDSGRVRVNLDGISNVTQKRDFPLSSPSELITTISNTLPREIRMLALTALGRLLRNQGDLGGATTAFTRALALGPGDPKTTALLNFYLGYLAERSGRLADLDQAIRYYNAALVENPLLYDARYNLGTLYLNRAYRHPADADAIRLDLDAAIDELTTVISVRPTYLLAYHNRGVARYERNLVGDLTAALNDFSHVIALDAQNSRAYFHRALTAIRAGAGEQWVADFEKTLALERGYYAAYNGLCWGYALAQEAVRALPLCDQAVALDPTGASRDSRGIVYAQMDRSADAVADFSVYLEWLQAEVDPTLYERYRGPLVETWIEALNQGENPFTPAVLNGLR